MTSEYFETGSKKGGRGMARRSLDLIGAMYAAAARANTITGRGIGYKLFVAKLIESMATGEMQKVYQLMKEARERGIIPWHWIVDEAEQASLKTIIEKWGARDAQPRMRKPRPVSAADAERQPHAAASGPTVQGAQMER